MDPKKDLAKRLRDHVRKRGGVAKDEQGKPVLPNGAWSMMLEAADYLDPRDVDDLLNDSLGG